MTKVSKILRDTNINIKTHIDKGNDPRKMMNFTQFQIIKYLLENDGNEVCQKDLEIETKLNKASITGALDSLEEKKLVKRIPSKDDKRKNIIVVTEKVENFKKDFEKRLDEVEKVIVKNISKEEMNVFLKVINKMNDNLAKDKE